MLIYKVKTSPRVPVDSIKLGPFQVIEDLSRTGLREEHGAGYSGDSGGCQLRAAADAHMFKQSSASG
jgi:hypothetical protein